MPITPTSTLSKNYQALGIDEIANDIETAFTTINATDDALVILEAQVNAIPGADATTVEVNISSAQIKANLGGGIELLPVPAVGTYYNVSEIVLEYTHVTTAYTLADPYLNVNGFAAVVSDILTSVGDKAFVIRANNPSIDSIENATMTGNSLLADTIYLNTWNGTSPTLGDGTLRAIITYTVRTFGA